MVFELFVKLAINQTGNDGIDHAIALVVGWWMVLEVATEFCTCTIVPHPETLGGNEFGCSKRGIRVASLHGVDK
ncbi:MAG: hypothetical protein AAFN70_19645 [Planctomycetota bacterium]